MIEGSDELDISSCDTMKPLSGFDPNKQLMLVRNPDYDAADGQTEARENYLDSFEIASTRTLTTSSTRSAAARSRTRSPASRPRCIREYSTDQELEDRLQGQLGRPHLVHHHEPDAAAVRRHPRAEGREPRHGQGGPAPRVGRPDRRRDRRPHHAGRDAQRRARRLRPVPDRGQRGRRSTRPRRR